MEDFRSTVEIREFLRLAYNESFPVENVLGEKFRIYGVNREIINLV